MMENKESKQQLKETLSEILYSRLKEKNLSFEAFLRQNNFIKNTCLKVFKGRNLPTLNTLIDILDALDLEIKIEKRINK